MTPDHLSAQAETPASAPDGKHWDARWNAAERDEAFLMASERMHDAQEDLRRHVETIATLVGDLERATRWVAAVALFRAQADAEEHTNG